MEEKLYYLGFSLFPGIGPALFTKLLKKFGSAKKAWESTKKEIQEIIGKELGETFFLFKETVDLSREMQQLEKEAIQLITWEDNKYPSLLQALQQYNKAPFLLYVKGDVRILASPHIIGIVGTRKVSAYGQQVTNMLTSELVAAGFTIVSGLALGVDAHAHMATMQNKGKTIAVLGCGVDCCYPRENQSIYNGILETGGAILSSFPRSMQASVGSFPARNAIIAGLSQGIVVTEGAKDSGSLITAAYAKKFSRPVFAVPGPITSPLSKGANSLIKEGAITVTTAGDILDRLAIIARGKSQITNPKKQIQGTREENKIMQLLESGPLHFDEIVRRIKKDSKTVGSLLSLMELKGIIKSNGSIYSLNF